MAIQSVDVGRYPRTEAKRRVKHPVFFSSKVAGRRECLLIA